MSNKIDGIGERPAQVNGGSRQGGVERTATAGGASAAPPADDRFTLTDSARQLQRLAEAVAAAPGQDSARVAELQELVARGEYRVDAQRVADRMIALERALTGQ